MHALSYKKYMSKKIKFILFIFTMSLFLMVFLFYKINNYWPIYVNRGPITGPLFLFNKLLVYGSGYSTLNTISLDSKTKTKKIDLISGNVVVHNISGKYASVTSGDSLWKINVKNMEPSWHFTNPDGFNFVVVERYKNVLLVGAKDGCLYAINYKTGKLLWKYSSENLLKMSSINHGDIFAFFGSMAVDNGLVYYASRDTYLYALDLNNGNLKWKFKNDSLIVTGPDIFSKYIILSTKSGNQLGINKYNGKLIWSSNSSASNVCSFFNFDFSNKNIFAKIVNIIVVKIKGAFIYELGLDGVVTKRNILSGNVVWKSESFGPDFKCPSMSKSRLLLVNKSGKVLSLSISTGRKLWEKEGFGQLTTKATKFTITPRKFKFIPSFVKKEAFVFANLNGKVVAVDALSGEKYWEFEARAPILSKIYINNLEIIIVSDDGVIYRINKNTGRAFLPFAARLYKTNIEKYRIGKAEIVEISLKSFGKYTYPWREAELSAYFSDENDKKIHVSGFYFDDNVWKVRFNPPTKGNWKWELVWSPYAGKFTSKGNFSSQTNTDEYYLKVLDKNKRRFTLDGKTIFNGIGMGMLVSDNNQSGNPLDDWAIGDSSIVSSTDSAGNTISIKSDNYIDFNKYIQVYGPSGAGFNMIRWSVNNASDSLDRGLEFPTTFLTSEGKNGDRFVKQLRDNNIHVWLTLFGFDVPYKYTLKTNEQFLLDSYVRYVVARYGSFIDIWELANEVSIPDNIEDFLINSIKYYDYQNKPISVSSEESGFNKSDVISPHWYETEVASKSDTRTVEEIEKYHKYRKPIVFAEQGNRYTNYDLESGKRMRFRSWTAFFNEAILIFWNNSSTKSFQPLLASGNLYIGEEERKYIKILQEFTYSFPSNSYKTKFDIDNPGVRNYGLTSDNTIAGYFYNFAKTGYKTDFRLSLYSPFSANVVWIDPSTGLVLKKDSCNVGFCILNSPAFFEDLAVKLTPY